jgi:hypothetical protein
MRTSEVGERRGEAGLAAKLKDEATAWRKSRPARAKFSMAGVQVVRIPKKRIPSTATKARISRP